LHFCSTLQRTQAVLQQRLDERLGDWHGLTLADYQLLQALAQTAEGLSLSALARALLQKPAALLRQLLPMEKTGLLERTQGLVRLRPAGRQLQAEAQRTTQAVYDQALAALGADASTLAACQQLLERLAAPVGGRL
jgi:DNA-binding MarR family transcriptional regulator